MIDSVCVKQLSKTKSPEVLHSFGGERECHAGPLGKCMTQILLEDKIQVVQNTGFETPDIVANYPSYCINKTTYLTKKVKCLGSIRKFCVLKECPIAIIDINERVPEGLLDAYKPSVWELKTVRNRLPVLNRYFAQSRRYLYLTNW